MNDLNGITNEQLKSFSEYLAGLSIGICEGCGDLHFLLTHHWHDQFDISTDAPYFTKSYTKRLCNECNQLLTRKGIYKFAKDYGYTWLDNIKLNEYLMSHILPYWNIQLAFIQYTKQLKLSRSKSYYRAWLGNDGVAYCKEQRQSIDNATNIFKMLNSLPKDNK